MSIVPASDTVGFVDECSDETFENFVSKLSKENDIVITFGRFDTWLDDKGKMKLNVIPVIIQKYLAME